MVTVEESNPLAVIYDILTLPFRTIAGLLGLPALPSPFDSGAGDGVLPPTSEGVPWVPPEPEPLAPGLRPPAPYNTSTTEEWYLMWYPTEKRWGFLTPRQYQFLESLGSLGDAEFAGVIPPGGTL